MTDNQLVATEAMCIICQQMTPVSEMTAGALYADGEQAFACLDHTWNRASWLLAWARFAISEGEKETQPQRVRAI